MNGQPSRNSFGALALQDRNCRVEQAECSDGNSPGREDGVLTNGSGIQGTRRRYLSLGYMFLIYQSLKQSVRGSKSFWHNRLSALGPQELKSWTR